MNITAKRLLVMFSAALNIGFVIVAVVLVYHHPPSLFRSNVIMNREFLSSLDLPEDLEDTVTASMGKMRATHRDFVRRLQKFRTEGLRLLSEPGTLDPKRFEMLNDGIVELMNRNNRAIWEHLLGIRSQLGDEKSARFFSKILKLVEKRGRKRLPVR